MKELEKFFCVVKAKKRCSASYELFMMTVSDYRLRLGSVGDGGFRDGKLSEHFRIDGADGHRPVSLR